VAEPALIPDVRLAAGRFAAASGGLCTDKAAESGQHTITKITAKTKAVNPSHRTSAASFGRLSPITGTALVAIIYPFVIVPAEIGYGLFVKLNRGSHRERRHWLLTSF